MVKKQEKKEAKQVFLLPEAMLINESLFEKDVYVDPRGKEGTPRYKIEMAFNPDDVEGEGTIEDALIDAACAEWGDSAEKDFLDGKIRSPFLDGNKLAKKREAKGKSGDAYKNKLVARADTTYNKDGIDGPGGIQVFAPDVSLISIANRSEIYPGCIGQMAVTIHCYEDNEGEPAMKFYLSAFQKTADGERLVMPKDHSSLFKPRGRSGSSEGGTTTRRRRAG